MEGADPEASPRGPAVGGARPPEVIPPSPEAVAHLRELSVRRLSVEEFDAFLRAPVSPHEEAANLELLSWFRRRYPTPAERLAYVRRAYPRWERWMPRSGGSGPASRGTQEGVKR